MHSAIARAASPSRIPVEDVNRMSRRVAVSYSHRLDVVGVIPTEGGGDRVEVFVSIDSAAAESSRVSVVVNRAVTYEELEAQLATRLRAVLAAVRPGERPQ